MRDSGDGGNGLESQSKLRLHERSLLRASLR